jgi:hypothetical protein
MMNPLKMLPILCLIALAACVDVDMSGDDGQVFAERSSELSLEWVIVQEGVAISCVDAGASEIEIAVFGESETRQRTSCFGGFAVVDAQTEGMSFVEVSLVSPAGDRLVTVELGEVELVSGATVPLGAVELTL